MDNSDTVMVEYDKGEDTILVGPPKRRKRKTWVLGKKLRVDEIEAGIERGRSAR